MNLFKNLSIINTIKKYYGFETDNKSGSIVTIDDGAPNVPISDGVFDIDYDANGYSSLNIGKSAVNLCGGAFLLSNAQEYLYGGTTDLTNKTFSFPANAAVTSGANGFVGSLWNKFKENVRYTLIFTLKRTGGNASNYSTNIRITYTDTTTSTLTVTQKDVKETIVFVTPANKSLKSVGKTNSSGTTTLYYDECGIFEGVLTEQDFEAWSGETHEVHFEVGKNLFDSQIVRSGFNITSQGTLNTNENYNVYALCAKSGKTYTFSFEDSETTLSKSVRILFKNQDTETNIDFIEYAYTDTNGRAYFSFTSPTTDYDLVLISLRTTTSNWQLEEGSTATTYEPYEYIYGGYFDSVTGMLFSTKAADGTDLATPVEYQLMPFDVETNDGITNIWCDTGDSDITYRKLSESTPIRVLDVMDLVFPQQTNDSNMLFDAEYDASSMAYEASINNYDVYWLSPNPTDSYIGYKFPSAVVVNAYEMAARNNGNAYDVSQSPRYWKIQGSNDDGTTWVDVFTSGHEFTASGERFAEAFDNTTAYKWWRMFISSAKQTDEGTTLSYFMLKKITYGIL